MALIIKPRSLGLLTKTERRPVGASYVVSAFGLFDLADPNPYRLEGEQAMWLMAAKELPPGAVFDLGMPKPTAEILVAGHAAAPGGEPVQRMGLAWAIGDIQKRLLVTGDRIWRLAGATAVPTEPQPFVQMPLTPQRCFGGEGHPANPAGVGFRAQERLMAREQVALPNIETPEVAIRSIGDAPQPPRFGPMAVDAKERLQYAGTYDEAWIKTLAPALAEDADPRLFLFAPQDQRLPGYLDGNEGYGLRNFAADAPEIQQHLPGFRVRCFIGWTDPQKPIVELPMRIDTLWFVAGARRGVMIYRGATPVEDIEAADIADVMLAYERMAEEPRPLSHYLQVRALRSNPETALKYALAEHQLTPPLPQSAIDAREARRSAAAEERRRKQRESTEWGIRQALANSGLPEALWPAIEVPEAEDHGVPLPLPEEIASGEIDLAGMLDALEALEVREMAKFEAKAQAQQPMMEVMNQIASGQAEPGAVDELLAMLGQPEIAAQIDAEIAGLPTPEALLELPQSEELTAGLAPVAGLRDWRRAVVEAAAGPAIDENEQLRLARARFLGLPEGRPLENIRNLSAEQLVLPDLPELPEPPAAAADSARPVGPLEDALLALEHSPSAPPGAAAEVKDALDALDAELGRLLPGLAGEAGSPLQALISSGEPETEGTPAGISVAREQLDLARSRVEALLDESETRISDAMAIMRLASPQPLKPDTPLTPAVAKAFGTLIGEQAREGFQLAGRDLAGADLSGFDLSGADLTGAFLENARLDGARLSGARLNQATLTGASLRGADLSGCDLTGANLSQVDGEGTRFDGARLIDTALLGARLSGASFEQAELSKLILMMMPFTAAAFRGARIADIILMRCALDETDWRGAVLDRVQIVDSTMERASFAGARLNEVGFMMLKAVDADFSDTQLASVAFAGDADLRRARFTRTAASRLTFHKADLTAADFAQGRFEQLCAIETTLAFANLRETSLKRAILSRNNLASTDFFAANLLEAQLNRADLTGASLRAANLFGADLMDATLFGADLSRANLTRTILAVASDVD